MKSNVYFGELIRIGNKSICVRIVLRKIHSKYKKPYCIFRKRWVHFEPNDLIKLKLGDKISFRPSKAFSSMKRYIFLDKHL